MTQGDSRHYDAAMSELPSEIIFAVEEAPEGGFVARALGMLSPRQFVRARQPTARPV
jgi:hypothetical protein